MTPPASRPAVRMLADPVHFVSLGGGAGLSPLAPGTVGTLVAVPLWWLLRDVPSAVYALILVGVFLFGSWAAGRTAAALGRHDHPAIVIDEVLGLLVTMVAAPAGIGWLVAGVVAFRVFDIAKPWPIGWVDRRMPGGAGIMLDDVLAGVWALAVLQLAAWVVLP